jgi:hypothetical protein
MVSLFLLTFIFNMYNSQKGFRKMLYDVIEYHWKTKEDNSIWEWLGISQVTWSVQKKKCVAKKHITKIQNYLDIDHNVSEKEFVTSILNIHYSKT